MFGVAAGHFVLSGSRKHNSGPVSLTAFHSHRLLRHWSAACASRCGPYAPPDNPPWDTVDKDPHFYKDLIRTRRGAFERLVRIINCNACPRLRNEESHDPGSAQPSDVHLSVGTEIVPSQIRAIFDGISAWAKCGGSWCRQSICHLAVATDEQPARAGLSNKGGNAGTEKCRRH